MASCSLYVNALFVVMIRHSGRMPDNASRYGPHDIEKIRRDRIVSLISITITAILRFVKQNIALLNRTKLSVIML